MNKMTRLLVVICMYFSSVTVYGVDVGYYSNKLYVHVPYGETTAREVVRNRNLMDEEPVFATYQETVQKWSYSDEIQSTHVVPKELKNNYRKAFNDKKWSDMWYLHDYRKEDAHFVLDLNVLPVYFEYEITGKGVNITVIDNGIEYSHPEILPNFNPDISYNFDQNNKDVTPNNDINWNTKRHGTNSVGVIIMQPNNKLCGIGIAYGARIGAIKVPLKTNIVISANAFEYALNYVDICNNSYGLRNMITAPDLIVASMSKGIIQGRYGKGVVYVFSNGNDKKKGSNCACDFYVNSINTIAVASCDDSGHPTYYSERCAGIMATAYGGDAHNTNLVTTDLNGKCINTFNGNSATAPILSGVIGLALSANPNLTWRDILHLLAWTSQVAPLQDNFGWNRNRAGFYYSIDFGFGLINAYKLVTKAKHWKIVPQMKTCGIHILKVRGKTVSRKKSLRIKTNISSCQGKFNEIKFIEQIQLVLTMTYSQRGDIQIAMKSPAGTEVHVLENRENDLNEMVYNEWSFLILAFWGESPRGEFIIDFYDNTGPNTNKGKIINMDLVIHGTNEAPGIYKHGPRSYEKFKLPSEGDEPKFLKLGSSSTKGKSNCLDIFKCH